MITKKQYKAYKRRVRMSILVVAFLALFLLPLPTKAANYGIASWYGGGEKLNIFTANGEVFNPKDITCASWDYPFNSLIKVTNITSGKAIIVRVNDRGPNKRLGRAIDLSRQAFRQIADLKCGLLLVEIEKLK